MKPRLETLALLAAVGLGSGPAAPGPAALVPAASRPAQIWFAQAADAAAPDDKAGWSSDAAWLKALPVGNGFLGAMIFGGVNLERIQLNEKSLWSGGPDDNDNPEAPAHLAEIRRLLFAGRYKEATELTEKTQVCRGAGSGQGNGAEVPYGCFQTLGDLRLDFGTSAGYSGYRRELDMDRGLVTIAYKQGGVRYRREIFSSYPDRALVIRLTADRKEALGFDASLTRPERGETRPDGDHLLMTGATANGKGGDGLRYAARLKAVTLGGSVAYEGGTAKVRGADEVCLILTAATDHKLEYPLFRGADPRAVSLDQLRRAGERPYAELLKRHVDDFSKLIGRVRLRLSDVAVDGIPTDVRLKNQKDGSGDLRLQELYFQYGRYLLASSSRPGSLPANLQGLWANKIQTPWNGDYHTDINVQMNYWPADTANLSECFEPLADLVVSLLEPGRRTAAVQYRAAGWCVHPITNVWGFTAPGEHPGWGLHVGAGGWLCRQLWDHYLFSGDRAYLERIYPVLMDSARFYLDWLVRDPRTGKLLSGPATSPENSFLAPDGSTAQMSMGPSHDQEVIHDAFDAALKAGQALGDTDPLLREVAAALKDLAQPGIGSDGRLMEWAEEFREKEPAHRHVSHLYMLYPGDRIDPRARPDLAAAARKSLEARTDAGTGWSLAWKVGFWARLEDGNRAHKLLCDLLRPVDRTDVQMSNAGGTYPNLFCAHPPFQIDGNFGAAAGMAEMLLQSHGREKGRIVVKRLPALPAAGPRGEAAGLRARGGLEVGLAWRKGELIRADIRSDRGGAFTLRCGDRSVDLDLAPGQTVRCDGRLAVS